MRKVFSIWGSSSNDKCNLLFVCDGNEGVKVYDVADWKSIKLLKLLPKEETYDVIAYNGIAYVVAKDGLYQYNYTDVNNIRLLSKLSN